LVGVHLGCGAGVAHFFVGEDAAGGEPV
jgi:hypothetical protein